MGKVSLLVDGEEQLGRGGLDGRPRSNDSCMSHLKIFRTSGKSIRLPGTKKARQDQERIPALTG